VHLPKLPPWARGVAALLLCLFLIHFWSSGVKNAVAFGAFLAVVIMHLNAKGKPERRIPRVSLHAPVAAYLVVALVSSLLSADRSGAMTDWLKLAELGAGYLALVTLLGRNGRPYGALRALGAAFALYLALDFGRSILALGDAWTLSGATADLPGRWNESLIGYITHAAGVTVTFMFIIAGLSFGLRRWWERLAGAVAVLISLFVIFVSWQARSAQLGTAVGIVLLAMLLARRKAVGVCIGVAALAVMVGGIVATGGGRWVSDSVFANDRFDVWQKTAVEIREEPVIGHGVGPKVFSGWYESIPYDERVVKTPGHPHNMLVQVAYETGALGLAAWVWLWVALAMSLWRSWRGARGGERAALAGLMVGLIAFWIYGQFSAALSLRPALLFWCLLGIAGAFEAARRVSHQEGAPARG